MTYNSTVTPDELNDLLSSSVNNCTEANGEQKKTIEGSVRAMSSN